MILPLRKYYSKPENIIIELTQTRTDRTSRYVALSIDSVIIHQKQYCSRECMMHCASTMNILNLFFNWSLATRLTKGEIMLVTGFPPVGS